MAEFSSKSAGHRNEGVKRAQRVLLKTVRIVDGRKTKFPDRPKTIESRASPCRLRHRLLRPRASECKNYAEIPARVGSNARQPARTGLICRDSGQKKHPSWLLPSRGAPGRGRVRKVNGRLSGDRSSAILTPTDLQLVLDLPHTDHLPKRFLGHLLVIPGFHDAAQDDVSFLGLDSHLTAGKVRVLIERGMNEVDQLPVAHGYSRNMATRGGRPGLSEGRLRMNRVQRPQASRAEVASR